MNEQERNYYRSLYELAAAVNSAGDRESVLNSLVENAAKALGAKGCSLMLLTPDAKTLLRAASWGLSDRYLQKGPLSADRSIAEALQGKPVAVLDAPRDDRVQYRQEAKQEGIASILSVPMRLRGQIIGVLRVYTGEPRQFSEEEIYFAEAAANLGAIALENARLYESLKKDYEEVRLELLEMEESLHGMR